ncbi:MAG TPA: NAD-dependent epimerase/dehydratase family protein [Gammaproteobacteria bacterium]|nr:NAD-dependent epimerase/dehydratase family protein [Gammaproteobacteria bacterium]
MSEWIAVTGATGFIGQAICRLLHATGWQVRALVRSRVRTQLLQGIVDEWVPGDLGDREALKRLCTNAIAVVHCAGVVRGVDAQAFDRVNVDGVRNLVEVMSSQTKPARLLCFSSITAREPDLSFYAASKYRGEQVLEQQAGALNWIALRPPAVYGPGDREMLPLFRLMAKGIAPVFGEKDARFSMLHVEDIARLVVRWLQCGPVANGIYSLHDGRPGGYNWDDVTAIVSRLCRRPVRAISIPPFMLLVPAWVNRALARRLGYAPMLTPEKLRELRHPDWVCDNDAIRKVLDWQPELQLEDGLKNTPGWRPPLD